MIPWKLAEAAFSRFWLLLIPIILAPIATMMLVVSEPKFYSQANVWVARPDNVDPGALLQTANPWETPAQAQATVLRDLLSTRSFREAVAVAAGLPPTAHARVWREVGIAAPGTNVVAVTATSSDPQVAERLVTATVDTYRTRALADATDGVQLQVDYFTAQIQIASVELASRQAALDAYVADHPDAGNPYNPDRAFQQLAGSVDAQTLIVNGLTNALQGIQREAAAAPQALNATFKLADPASHGQPIGESVTKRLGYPLIALFFGAAISATYLYVVFRIDHAIRTSQDLVDLPVPVLGFVPQVRRSKFGFLRLPLPAWLSLRSNREYARHLAASMSLVSASPEAPK